MNTTSTDIFTNNKLEFYHIKFVILLILQIPSITLSIIIFIFFITHRAALRTPQNHGLLLLLAVHFTRLSFSTPLTLRFYYLGYVSPATPVYCTWWTFFEYTFYVSSEYLLATISIQRHMFIFHTHVLRIRWKRYVLHHLPLLLSIVYSMLFYVFSILLYPCDGTQWDFTNNLCGFADCYLLFDKVLGTFDMSINNGMPMIIDILANITLILRVAMRKHRFRQSAMWRQQRRMIVQLFCLSSLYLVGWTPILIVELVQILVDPTFLVAIQMDYIFDLINVVYLFLPWMCLTFFPEIVKWIKNICHYRKARNTVGTTQTRTIAGTVQALRLEG
ncbi:unnamed protein product [Rotaria magnacalcarata]|uniref:G-protein coupled receptors family 1 profile domain-containing protein n=1 Tax=Rotaria magnacalcarata TaxID=392030 RepID=A0A816LHB1_9BILA|nr:unnamed protein product [Rotaria magnacalcarata]